MTCIDDSILDNILDKILLITLFCSSTTSSINLISDSSDFNVDSADFLENINSFKKGTSVSALSTINLSNFSSLYIKYRLYLYCSAIVLVISITLLIILYFPSIPYGLIPYIESNFTFSNIGNRFILYILLNLSN